MQDPLWSCLSLKHCTPWYISILEQFLRNWSLWERVFNSTVFADVNPLPYPLNTCSAGGYCVKNVKRKIFFLEAEPFWCIKDGDHDVRAVQQNSLLTLPHHSCVFYSYVLQAYNKQDMTEAPFPVAGKGKYDLSEWRNSHCPVWDSKMWTVATQVKLQLCFLCCFISKRAIGKRHTSHTLAKVPNIHVFPSPPVAA